MKWNNLHFRKFFINRYCYLFYRNDYILFFTLRNYLSEAEKFKLMLNNYFLRYHSSFSAMNFKSNAFLINEGNDVTSDVISRILNEAIVRKYNELNRNG